MLFVSSKLHTMLSVLFLLLHLPEEHQMKAGVEHWGEGEGGYRVGRETTERVLLSGASKALSEPGFCLSVPS